MVETNQQPQDLFISSMWYHVQLLFISSYNTLVARCAVSASPWIPARWGAVFSQVGMSVSLIRRSGRTHVAAAHGAVTGSHGSARIRVLWSQRLPGCGLHRTHQTTKQRRPLHRAIKLTSPPYSTKLSTSHGSQSFRGGAGPPKFGDFDAQNEMIRNYWTLCH